MAGTYYQVGGFRPHIRWFQSTYDDKRLAETIAGNSSPLRLALPADRPLELVLGITPHGSSHLLLTADQTRRIANANHLPLPRVSPVSRADFESLSPIYFQDVEELTQKLAKLKPKAKKSGDSSQANRGYPEGTLQLTRGAFEHGRLIYRILNDSVVPQMYGAQSLLWMADLEISAFVFNTKGIDDRLNAVKILNPHVLDIGFCRATLPDVTPALNTAKHIIPFMNSMLGRKGIKQSFKYGASEKLPEVELAQGLQDIFLSCSKPMILLVNHAEQTMNYLRNHDVDVSQWREGIKELLYPFPSSSTSSVIGRRRSRSLSPSPGPSRSESRYPPANRSPAQTNLEPTRRPVWAPVYVVDVMELYRTLMHAADAKTTNDIALRLQVTDEEGWCAGNEASLMIDIWRAMVTGPPIDDQRMLRTSVDEEDDEDADGPTAAGDSDRDFEEDEDPIASMAQAQKAQAAAIQKGPKQSTYLDLDESDYGGSDSE